MQCKCMIPVTIARAGIRQIAREMGIGETNAVPAARRGPWQIEDETE